MGIADDILKRKLPKNNLPEKKQSPATIAIGKSADAEAVFADTEPTIANREFPRFATNQIVHVDNLSEISNSTIPENLVQINGVSLSSPTATSPVGTETAQITRDISRKFQYTESTTPLLAGAVFTGPWHDSVPTGANFVMATAVSNVASAATVGLQILESDDQINLRPVTSLGAALVTRAAGFIRARYWRLVFTNGASNQASFLLTATESSKGPTGGTNTTGPFDQFPVTSPLSNGDASDNQFNASIFPDSGQNRSVLCIANYQFGGAFSGTTDLGRRGWSRTRTPTVFRTVQASALGNTAIWTPAANNKFRILKYYIELTNNASIAAAGVVTVQFFDGAAAIPIAQDIFVPAAAGALVGVAFHTGWNDLGYFGILSAAANNVLNVNLSVALASGNFRVIVAGTEE